MEKEKAEKEIYKRQSALSKGGSQEAQIKLIERINKEVDDQIYNRDDPGIFGFIGTFLGYVPVVEITRMTMTFKS